MSPPSYVNASLLMANRPLAKRAGAVVDQALKSFLSGAPP
jgi:hypothetical protein